MVGRHFEFASITNLDVAMFLKKWLKPFFVLLRIHVASFGIIKRCQDDDDVPQE